MFILKISTVALVSGLSIAALVTPVQAASSATRAFMDNAMPNLDFLDRSSRMVLQNTSNPKLRDYARSEAADATNAANALYDWSQAGGQTVLASVNGEAPLQTGRSVALDKTVAVDDRLPRGQEDIDALYGAEGKDLDVAFKQAQIDALSQIQTDYRDYIARGDDLGLKALATRELPKVTKQLAAINKL